MLGAETRRRGEEEISNQKKNVKFASFSPMRGESKERSVDSVAVV
jgi:hypothetical protein